ncbi:MAG: hypothetical protein HY033_04145 [Ignavibacteriae bacterium]|nr:hypothetical protein [Ignavibacteria bacterium]MBI3364079.1 hypothetical protein [Ignavibacteriota bacterium]
MPSGNCTFLAISPPLCFAVDDVLRADMSGMITEVGLKLDNVDPSQFWFGLNKPGTTSGADTASELMTISATPKPLGKPRPP